MKIKKYIKISKNKYQVILEDDTTLVLYEDIILKFELLLTKEIKDLKTIQEENQKYELYDKVLLYISKKLRSELEIRKYLSKYTTNKEDIDNIIDRLYKNNLLNNKLYLKSYINDKINLTYFGPIKIKNDLINLGFNEFEIDMELVIFDEYLIKEKINKYLSKQLKSNKKSLYVFKNKMLVNLCNLGYSREDILKYLNNISFSDDNLKEKEIEKLRKKYEKKYSGYELEKIIKRKLYEKGYRD